MFEFSTGIISICQSHVTKMISHKYYHPDIILLSRINRCLSIKNLFNTYHKQKIYLWQSFG